MLSKPADPTLSGVSAYMRDWPHLALIQGVLQRRHQVFCERRLQLVLPEKIRIYIFKVLHDDLGHQGRDRTTSLFKERFYWPGMDSDIATMVRNCGRCVRRKHLPSSTRLVPIRSSYPMQIICVDFLSLERSKGGYEDVLVITYHFSRYAQAYSTRNQTAKTTAKMFSLNILLLIMVSQHGFIEIKTRTLSST